MENPQDQSASAPPSTAADSERRADYEDAIGANVGYYLKRFEQFDAGGSRAGWHWPAFLVPSWWCLYRKLWAPGILFLFWPLIVILLATLAGAFVINASVSKVALVWLITSLVAIAPYVLVSIFANSLYWRRTNRLMARVAARFPRDATQQRQARLKLEGGTSIGPMLGIILGFGFFLTSILAAIAIPAYQDYTIRSQVVEGLNLASDVKAAVATYQAQHQAWPEQSDLRGELPRGMFVTQVNVEGGSVVITYGNEANKLISGQRLALQPGLAPNGDIVWTCGYKPPPDGVTPGTGPHGSDVPAKYLPSACRAP